jgi:hypothetical protein
MRHKKLFFIIIMFLGLGLTGLQAQESLNATGGNASGSGGTVSYSVGQMVYNTYNGTNGSLAEGIQQAYEISELTLIEEHTGIYLIVSAYPNPVKDYLILEIEGELKSEYFVSLYDINSKLLQNKKITGNETNMFIGNYKSGLYFVKVTENQKEIKSFKIIKQ